MLADVAIGPPVAVANFSFRVAALATFSLGSTVAAVRAGFCRNIGQSWYELALALPAPKVAVYPHTNDAISTRAKQRRIWRIGPIQAGLLHQYHLAAFSCDD